MDSRLQDIVARSEQLERRLSQMTKTEAMNQATIIALRTDLSAAAAAAAKEPVVQIDTAGVHRAIEIKMAQLQAELARARREASRWRDMRAGEIGALVDSARERLANVVERIEVDAADEVLKGLVADNTLLRHDNLQLAGVLQEVRREAKRLREENDEWRGTMASTTTKLPATPADGFPRPLTLTGTPSHTHTHTHTRHYSLTPSLASVRSNPPPYTHNRQDSWQAATSPRVRNNSAAAADSCEAIVEGEEGQHARDVSLSSVSSGPGPSAFASASIEQQPPQPRRKRLSLTPSFRPPVSPLGEGYFPPARGMVSIGVQTDEAETEAKVDGRPTLRGLGLEDTSSRVPSRRGSETSHATPTTPYSTFTPASMPDSTTASLLVLADHIGKILQRVRQADVPTLTRRLRRQHLAGDVGHLSASTIKALMRDIDGLRAHARGLLEEERRQPAPTAASLVARKDFMHLVKLFKELLGELVELRGVVNRVILDPGEVARMRDAVAAAVEEQGETRRGAAGATLGWIAPTIQKLFTGTAAEPTTSAAGAAAASATANSGTTRGPKLEPSTSASTTHVNVEFASTGIIRRSTLAEEEGPVVRQRQQRERPAMTLGDGSVRQRAGLMGIFAGAQRPVAATATTAPTIRAKPSMEFGAKRHGHRRQISNAVDAVIDQPVPEDDALPPLLERTLRPRGLSDSSIRSTFQSHAVPVRATKSPDAASAAAVVGSYWDVKTLGRRIQGYAAEGTGKGSLAAQNRGYMEVLAGTTPVMSRSFSRGDV
ncbi:hypothetical protein NliqN6_4380 [Naganishia liquefaciens]|uniref:Uncharacterized protein n=1 Tax=Naganishia liquefaciens TaxID=104408 RepID=A0A8H3TW61_9TREE|nr:hypothetical protein NliqN6_4380 [Naganishia liquefaciens]